MVFENCSKPSHLWAHLAEKLRYRVKSKSREPYVILYATLTFLLGGRATGVHLRGRLCGSKLLLRTWLCRFIFWPGHSLFYFSDPFWHFSICPLVSILSLSTALLLLLVPPASLSHQWWGWWKWNKHFTWILLKTNKTRFESWIF